MTTLNNASHSNFAEDHNHVAQTTHRVSSTETQHDSVALLVAFIVICFRFFAMTYSHRCRVRRRLPQVIISPQAFGSAWSRCSDSKWGVGRAVCASKHRRNVNTMYELNVRCV